MTAARTAKTSADQAALREFAKTDIGRSLFELAREAHASDARAAARRAALDSEAVVAARIESQLAAERQAFDEAGLTPFDGIDTEGHVSPHYWKQPVVLLNANAHPSSLVAAALARAERAQSFARVFAESSELDPGGAEAAYSLARMIEEVVDVLHVTLGHRAIKDAPASTMHST